MRYLRKRWRLLLVLGAIVMALGVSGLLCIKALEYQAMQVREAFTAIYLRIDLGTHEREVESLLRGVGRPVCVSDDNYS